MEMEKGGGGRWMLKETSLRPAGTEVFDCPESSRLSQRRSNTETSRHMTIVIQFTHRRCEHVKTGEFPVSNMACFKG